MPSLSTLSMPRALINSLLVALSLFVASSALGQALVFTPYHANGTYDLGEKVGWNAALPAGTPAPAGPYTYTVKKNNQATIKTGTLDLSSGKATLELTMDEPAMLYIQVRAPAGAA